MFQITFKNCWIENSIDKSENRSSVRASPFSFFSLSLRFVLIEILFENSTKYVSMIGQGRKTWSWKTESRKTESQRPKVERSK